MLSMVLRINTEVTYHLDFIIITRLSIVWIIYIFIFFNTTNEFYRYYWIEENVFIRAVNAEFKYGYEYLGNTGRLVITPLTDRYEQCFLEFNIEGISILYIHTYAHKQNTHILTHFFIKFVSWIIGVGFNFNLTVIYIRFDIAH